MHTFHRLCRALVLAPVVVAIAACASIAPPAPLVNVPVTLGIGGNAALRPGLSISFDGVNDSRCPLKAQCIWAGQLLYLLTLHGRGAEPFTLGDAVPGFTAASGLTVHLANEHPPPLPLPIVGQPPPTYTVMLLINSN